MIVVIQGGFSAKVLGAAALTVVSAATQDPAAGDKVPLGSITRWTFTAKNNGANPVTFTFFKSSGSNVGNVELTALASVVAAGATVIIEGNNEGAADITIKGLSAAGTTIATDFRGVRSESE